MSIGTSLGAYFDDDFHYQASQWDPKYDTNEYDPGEVQQKIESQPAKVTPVSDRIDVYQGEAPKSDSVSFLSAGKALNSAVDYTIGALSDPVKTVTNAATGLAESAKNAFTLPGDVLSGKVQPGSSQEIERAADLAGFMVTGPAPVASKLADGTLGSFMGVKSKTFDKNALGGAQVFEGEGMHPDDIWNKTGTFKGADGRWRQEIDDSKAKFNQDWNVFAPRVEGYMRQSLGKILDHPDLYNAYPQLKHMEVTYDPRHPSAQYDSLKDTITMGARNDKDTLLHEIQHAIQEHEGFGRGGAPANNFTLNYQSDLNKLRTEAQSYLSKQSKGEKLTSAETDRLPYLEKVFQTEVLRRQAGAARARENYLSLAGEVESRNVETRALLNKKERTQIPPQGTEDVPRNNQFVSDYPIYATPYGYGDPKTPPIP